MADDDVLPSRRLLGHEIHEAHTGVPAYLDNHLRPLIADALDELDRVELDLMALKLGANWNSSKTRLRAGVTLTGAVRTQLDDGRYLDLLQLALRADNQRLGDSGDFARAVEVVLSVGGSAYAVSPDGRSIVHRNDPVATAAAASAVAEPDDAGEELANAWNLAFGREPDAQAAWSAAIRAVEELLIPIIWPDSAKRGKQTISSARGRLVAEPSTWTVDHPKITMDAFVAMLGSLAYEPGRHGADANPTATLRDAAAAVHLAVTLVSWLRAGLLDSVTS